MEREQPSFIENSVVKWDIVAEAAKDVLYKAECDRVGVVLVLLLLRVWVVGEEPLNLLRNIDKQAKHGIFLHNNIKSFGDRKCISHNSSIVEKP